MFSAIRALRSAPRLGAPDGGGPRLDVRWFLETPWLLREGVPPTMTLVALTAAVGLFDLSSTERTWVANKKTTNSTYGTGGAGGILVPPMEEE